MSSIRVSDEDPSVPMKVGARREGERCCPLPAAHAFWPASKVLCIGAGASGLVTAKFLKEAGHHAVIVDGGKEIGGTFENKRYEGARMVSSKYLTCFSDFRRPDSETHWLLSDYVKYLEDYADHFKLRPLIRFETRVSQIHRPTVQGQRQSYIVDLACKQSDGTVQHTTESFDAVAVCSGLHNVPRLPTFKGQDQFKGDILHSAHYKDPAIFKGKRVLVLGTGETGFDVAYAAATNGAETVHMGTRHGFVSVPSSFGEDFPPLDCLIINFGTHAWESLWSRRVGFHWWISSKFIRAGLWMLTGSAWGFNQWVGKRFNMTWDDGRKHIANKSVKAMPLLTRPVKRREANWRRGLFFGLPHYLLRKLLRWDVWDAAVDHIGTDITLIEGSVNRIDAETVTFDKNSGGEARVEADLIVLATGYRQRFPFLFPKQSKEGQGAKGKMGAKEEKGEKEAQEAWGEGWEADDGTDDPLPSEHFIINPEDPRLAFIGFVRPNVGAIPPISELQVMWWLERLSATGLKGEKSDPVDPQYYKLKESRLCYGVDYGESFAAMFCDVQPRLTPFFSLVAAQATTCSRWLERSGRFPRSSAGLC